MDRSIKGIKMTEYENELREALKHLLETQIAPHIPEKADATHKHTLTVEWEHAVAEARRALRKERK